jgi:transcriptional regulator with XRE-family HTH domain
MVEKLRIRYPDFGTRVRDAMGKHGVTRRQIAEALGVKVEMARRYAEGKAKPRHDKMRDLARLLGNIDPALLEWGTGGLQVASEQAGYGHFSIEAREIAAAWDMLPEVKKRLYREAILHDSAVAVVFPEISMGVIAKSSYHSMIERFRRDRANLERQMKLKLDP